MIETTLAAVFGLLIGSFLNVCIYRWPRDLSVVRPRSHCPACGQPVAWFDNVPVLSFLILRGRCRGCHVPISLRYPAVELLTALFFGWFAYRHGWTLDTLRSCVFSAILITLIFADAETRILPDEFTLGGAMAGLVFALFLPVPDISAHALAFIFDIQANPHVLSLAEGLLGAIVPSGSLWLGGLLFEKLRHKEGLGFGDVKMIAMIGAFLGLRAALLTLIVGSTLGSVIGLAYIAISRKDARTYQLPLGAFLGIGGLAVELYGQLVIDWYARRL
ncbi:MAG: prepilin peptidase [Acidobacteriota bacterium]|nr:prepilin peptidase [Acidobacteriota bacterium]